MAKNRQGFDRQVWDESSEVGIEASNLMVANMNHSGQLKEARCSWLVHGAIKHFGTSPGMFGSDGPPHLIFWLQNLGARKQLSHQKRPARAILGEACNTSYLVQPQILEMIQAAGFQFHLRGVKCVESRPGPLNVVSMPKLAIERPDVKA